MAKFSEMPARTQVMVIAGIAGAITVALYFLVYRGMSETNQATRVQLEAKQQEIAVLLQYEPRLPELRAQIEQLRQQLDTMKRIVPDEKEAPRFMHLMQDTAAAAGIEIRRYTALPVANREFYTEVPFEMELDGPYWAILSFFDRVARLERIVNVANLQMAAVEKATEARVVKRKYLYGAGQSAVVSYVATTFYSPDLAAPANPAATPAAATPAAGAAPPTPAGQVRN